MPSSRGNERNDPACIKETWMGMGTVSPFGFWHQMQSHAGLME